MKSLGRKWIKRSRCWYIIVLLCVGGYLLQMSGRSATLEAGQKAISEVLMNGKALQKFQAMLEAQGVAAHISHTLCSEKAEYFKHLRRGQYQTELQALDDGKHTSCRYCGLNNFSNIFVSLNSMCSACQCVNYRHRFGNRWHGHSHCVAHVRSRP